MNPPPKGTQVSYWTSSGQRFGKYQRTLERGPDKGMWVLETPTGRTTRVSPRMVRKVYTTTGGSK